MKNNIAILSLYYRNANYGGVLQAYALQRVLEEQGNCVKQISYDLLSGYKKPHKHGWYKIIAELYHLLKYRGWMLEFHRQQKLIYDFADTIPHTKKVTASTIGKLANDFDFFICGSDQIWNPIGWQTTLFLDFLPKDKRRIAYAASVSKDILSEDELRFMGRYLMNFEQISVRESNTTKQLKEQFPDVNIQTMPDPVLLLSRETWTELLVKSQKNENYILAYFLGHDKEQRNQIISYARTRNMHLKFISHLDWNDYGWERNNKIFLTGPIGVSEFLSLIANAELVVTDSFHGTVFAALFNSPFVALERIMQDRSASMVSRIATFLGELGCSQRLVRQLEAWETYSLKEEETQIINKNIDRLRSRGQFFLKEAIDRSSEHG